jgi:hypothetical protein
MDADEVVTKSLRNEIKAAFSQGPSAGCLRNSEEEVFRRQMDQGRGLVSSVQDNPVSEIPWQVG